MLEAPEAAAAGAAPAPVTAVATAGVGGFHTKFLALAFGSHDSLPPATDEAGGAGGAKAAGTFGRSLQRSP